MLFFIGLLVGLVLAYASVALSFYLHYRYRFPATQLQAIERAVRPRAAILTPRSEQELRHDRIISENDAAGRDTKLEELL